MNEDARFCTTDDCNRLTTLYLCTTCIVELADLLDDVHPILQLIDHVIYRLTVTKAPGSSGGGGVSGSKPAMNVDAYMLKAHLHTLPESAHGEAMTNATAGRTLFMARIWIREGRDLVWGPEDKRVYGQCGVPIPPSIEEHLQAAKDETPTDRPCPGRLVAHPDDTTVQCPECKTSHMVAEILDELRDRVRGEPSTPTEVRAHLQKKARVTVTRKDIENWARRGHIQYVLDRVGLGTKERRLYFPGDVLMVAEQTRSRRRY